jgi:HSP20 family protein
MTYFIAPHPYRMARHFARMAGFDRPDESCLAVDIREEAGAYVVNALVPGLKAEDLNIQVLDNTVTIEGEFKNDGSEYLVQELPSGSFHRTLQLPAALDASKAEARINNGLLTLRLVKVESAQPRTIKVNAK